MSFVQIVCITLGVLIIISTIDLKSIKAYLSDKQNQIDDKPTQPVNVVIKPESKDELVSIVQKWQSLKTACDNNKLTQASSKLDEIFPMLIKVEK